MATATSIASATGSTGAIRRVSTSKTTNATAKPSQAPRTCATKYLAGHSDLIAGAVASSRKIIDRVRQIVIYLGDSMDPDAAFLLIRGMKTLEVRVRRQ